MQGALPLRSPILIHFLTHVLFMMIINTTKLRSCNDFRFLRDILNCNVLPLLLIALLSFKLQDVRYVQRMKNQHLYRKNLTAHRVAKSELEIFVSFRFMIIYFKCKLIKYLLLEWMTTFSLLTKMKRPYKLFNYQPDTFYDLTTT